VLTLDNRVYLVFLILETVQFLYHTMNVGFDFLWKTQVTGYLQSAMMYFDYGSVMSGSAAFITLLSVNMAFFIIMVLCIAINVIGHFDRKPKITSIKVYSLKLLNMMVILLRTILAIPFWQAIILGLQGRGNQMLDDIPDPIVYCCIASAVVGGIVFLIFQGLYNGLFL
jgi:hypothetical protein